jgi:hypothetical protein
MGLLFTGCEHLHRRFVGMSNALSQHGLSQGILQRLKLLSDPLS